MVEDDDDSDYGHSKKKGKKVIRQGRTNRKEKKSPKPRLKATVTPSPAKGKGKGRPSTKALEKSSPKEEEEEEPESQWRRKRKKQRRRKALLLPKRRRMLPEERRRRKRREKEKERERERRRRMVQRKRHPLEKTRTSRSLVKQDTSETCSYPEGEPPQRAANQSASIGPVPPSCAAMQSRDAGKGMPTWTRGKDGMSLSHISFSWIGFHQLDSSLFTLGAPGEDESSNQESKLPEFPFHLPSPFSPTLEDIEEFLKEKMDIVQDELLTPKEESSPLPCTSTAEPPSPTETGSEPETSTHNALHSPQRKSTPVHHSLPP
ncbi:hypothetical protein WMY93_016033 [Mugilogobius chulae]|uniref:Uncharacterized protein n=1 Tax=Mugilogobius chulae TaxID=88201 RepID=A0AAW0NWN8_9GOBI